MAAYFDLFPQILYSMNGKKSYDLVTNIFFRIAFLNTIKTLSSSYYFYIIKDGDTPEILADKFYKNPEAHWIIMMFNNIIDPEYDWPLDNRTFNRYITQKYGSIPAAQQSYNLYTKTIDRVIRNVNGRDTVTTSFTHMIDYVDPQGNTSTNFADTFSHIPYDTYLRTPHFSFENIETDFGASIETTETISRMSDFDYEVMINDKKREIRILDPAYYPQIMEEFKNLVKDNSESQSIGYKTARI